MFSRGRSVTAEFSEAEYLFQRLANIGYQEGESATENAQKISEQIRTGIRFPEQSVNRGRFGKPVDVLFPSWCNEGVFGDVRRCLSEQLSAEASSSNKKNAPAVWSFRIEHSPYWCNYAHSNIYVEKNGARLGHDDSRKVSPFAKKRLREEIANDKSTQIFHKAIPGKWFAWFRRRVGL